MEHYEIEDNLPVTRRKRGSIEVICGSMFSGKTEELIRRLRRASIAKMNVEIFKPAIDVRYDEEQVVSHDRNVIESTPVNHSGNILLMSSEVDVVGIDEAQFFDDGLVDVVQKLADQACEWLLPGWIWTLGEGPSVPCPHFVPLPIR